MARSHVEDETRWHKLWFISWIIGEFGHVHFFYEANGSDETRYCFQCQSKELLRLKEEGKEEEENSDEY